VNEKQSSAPTIAIVAIVALALLAVPCLLGMIFMAGALLWRMEAAPERLDEMHPPPPVLIPEPQVEPVD
jgi:hypothetical protein